MDLIKPNITGTKNQSRDSLSAIASATADNGAVFSPPFHGGFRAWSEPVAA
ncbi:MAG: hypothetical protein ACYC3B_05825 [Sedimentisphaerales bacterium]